MVSEQRRPRRTFSPHLSCVIPRPTHQGRLFRCRPPGGRVCGGVGCWFEGSKTKWRRNPQCGPLHAKGRWRIRHKLRSDTEVSTKKRCHFAKGPASGLVWRVRRTSMPSMLLSKHRKTETSMLLKKHPGPRPPPFFRPSSSACHGTWKPPTVTHGLWLALSTTSATCRFGHR